MCLLFYGLFIHGYKLKHNSLIMEIILGKKKRKFEHIYKPFYKSLTNEMIFMLLAEGNKSESFHFFSLLCW